MKLKLITLAILLIVSAFILCGCQLGNRQIGIDFKQSFDEAYIYGVDGSLIAHGKIQSWRDFDESDVVQITIDNYTYLTHYCNTILVRNDRNH